ncbi:MAG: hypothetical protein Ct9H300mP1_32700 [Planctomycetaceae bacterium]|nr:MAG: hypothetical protein Ct9H300mP1_32700 [Planctomycetaceae bacterium]
MGHPIQIDRGCAGGLEIHRGRTGYRFRPVIGKRLVLGSAPECDLRLGGAGMPPVHSQVHVDGGRVWIEAISADPPILINGEPCQMTLLVDGDVIALGPFAFTWRAAEAPVVAASPAENLSMDELVERLEQDMAMVADRDATTRQAVATVVEAALETLYDGKPVPREVAGGGGPGGEARRAGPSDRGPRNGSRCSGRELDGHPGAAGRPGRIAGGPTAGRAVRRREPAGQRLAGGFAEFQLRFSIVTTVLGGTLCISETLAPMTDRAPMTVSPPSTVALA